MFTFARSASLNAATRYCIAFIFFVSSILFSYDFEMHFFYLKADCLDDFFQGISNYPPSQIYPDNHKSGSLNIEKEIVPEFDEYQDFLNIER